MNRLGIYLSSYFVGLIFALGLGIAGLTQPQKIIAFLDFTGNWDPALLLTMGAAIVIHALAYPMISRRKSPLFDSSFHMPKRTTVNSSLIVGSALFGIGWGISGFCPGPSLMSLASLQAPSIVFLCSMLVGMFLAKVATRHRSIVTQEIQQPARG